MFKLKFILIDIFPINLGVSFDVNCGGIKNRAMSNLSSLVKTEGKKKLDLKGILNFLLGKYKTIFFLNRVIVESIKSLVYRFN